MSQSENDDRSSNDGNKLARIVATVIASLVGASIMAGGSAVVSNSLVLASLSERVDTIRDDTDKLQHFVSSLPPAADLSGLRERVYELGRASDRNNSAIESFRNDPKARSDPFTGEMGRQMDDRIRKLEER